MHTYLVLVLILCSHILAAQNSFPLSTVSGSDKEGKKIHVLDENRVKSYLSEHMLDGKIYLVSIWASWCGSCRGELRAIQKVHCDWSEKYNFEFLAISIDAPKDYSKIYKLANKMDWNFKILHEEYGYLVRELDIFKIPRMFLVDQNGNIVYEPKGYGINALKKLEEKIRAL